jgi:tRNA-specific 2-thiouridylase
VVKAKEIKKVLVAMSGGVDSSVAAVLLKERTEYDLASAYIKVWLDEDDPLGVCPAEEDIADGRAVSEKLGIPFSVVNLVREYKEKVVDYLVEGYRIGVTPNPDIMCNREMKFGIFLDYALKQGYDAVATGHYCRRRENEDGSFDILSGVDNNKDQSYFLAMVRQDQLKHILFPIGEIEKPEVRKIAEANDLVNAKKKDSQGICFLGKVKINEFLKTFIPDKPGDIVNAEGKVLGEHKGLHRYTIGQRKGIGIPSNSDFNAYVVVGKDLDKNKLIVAFDREDAPGLYAQRVLLSGLSFVNRRIDRECKIQAKPRYRDESQPITFIPETETTGTVIFDEPQRALATGQVMALYDGEVLLGGGFYQEIESIY